MANHLRKSKGKEIRPTYFMFCEGESEEAYISFIRNFRRIPIQIKAKVAKNKINQRFVDQILRPFPKHKKDKIFLLYDLDVAEMLEKLRLIKDTILLVSNPCIELWFLLHTTNHTATVTSQQCVENLERNCKGYKKGFICEKLRNDLTTGTENASKRAKRLTQYNNPSTSVYLLLEELNKL
jgi:hypothetical protein